MFNSELEKDSAISTDEGKLVEQDQHRMKFKECLNIFIEQISATPGVPSIFKNKDSNSMIFIQYYIMRSK